MKWFFILILMSCSSGGCKVQSMKQPNYNEVYDRLVDYSVSQLEYDYDKYISLTDQDAFLFLTKDVIK